ncbi:MAG: tetratricopeptide repeat protein [Spirochaetia bacterium]|jgi:tetratricopeptide (TPR) repeat protein|nr:tetratricopeptide repeat protein [Spirochaetia bacterium]
MTDSLETRDIFEDSRDAEMTLPEYSAQEADREDQGAKNERPEIAGFSQKGYLYLKENQISAAEECFKKILEFDADNNYALVGMGDVSRKKADFAAAIQYYDACLKHHPGNNYALFGLADCYKAFKNYHKAIEIWEHYLRHDNKNVTVLTRIADIYRKVRNLQKSRAIYQQVLAMEENNPYALIGLGHLHYDFKEYDKALFYWERMIDACGPGEIDIRVLTSVGNCHRKMKNFPSGIDVFRKALAIVPDNFYALFGMADCYRGMEMHEQAFEYWNKILARDPSNKVILTRAGEECRAMGKFEEARTLYEKALNIEYDAYAVMGLALINKEQGRYAEALTSLEVLLKSGFKNSRIYTEIADCHTRLGQPQKAAGFLALRAKGRQRAGAGCGPDTFHKAPR